MKLSASWARHHFTLAEQVDQLVSASEADPDQGFMGRMMALCSLPRTNPGDRLQYKRVNGPYKLIMIADGDNKLPSATAGGPERQGYSLRMFESGAITLRVGTIRDYDSAMGRGAFGQLAAEVAYAGMRIDAGVGGWLLTGEAELGTTGARATRGLGGGTPEEAIQARQREMEGEAGGRPSGPRLRSGSPSLRRGPQLLLYSYSTADSYN